MNWQLPLVIAAALFGGFMIWRSRPILRGPRRSAASRGALREAKKRVEQATTAKERALALCDAGDACAASFRTTSAIGYYLRAMRADPTSPFLVERAAMGLGRRPHALESLLWRRLGAEPWCSMLLRWQCWPLCRGLDRTLCRRMTRSGRVMT